MIRFWRRSHVRMDWLALLGETGACTLLLLCVRAVEDAIASASVRPCQAESRTSGLKPPRFCSACGAPHSTTVSSFFLANRHRNCSQGSPQDLNRIFCCQASNSQAKCLFFYAGKQPLKNSSTNFIKISDPFISITKLLELQLWAFSRGDFAAWRET